MRRQAQKNPPPPLPLPLPTSSLKLGFLLEWVILAWAAKGGKGASGCIEQLLLGSSALPTLSYCCAGLVFQQAKQFSFLVFRCASRTSRSHSLAHSDSHVCLFARLPFCKQVSRVSAAEWSESCFSASNLLLLGNK